MENAELEEGLAIEDATNMSELYEALESQLPAEDVNYYKEHIKTIEKMVDTGLSVTDNGVSTELGLLAPIDGLKEKVIELLGEE